MPLPFTHDAFLDVFGRYNSLLWPASLLLWAATAAIGWRWFAGRAANGRVLAALLAVHWAWSGVAYHWFFFREINPAAAIFAAAFVLQAALFTWLALRPSPVTRARAGARGAVGGALVAYGLAYPALGMAFGLEFPRMPLFAVPCPATLVTAGFLIAASGVPRVVSVVPVLWSVIGTSAAVVLGIRADLALAIAALALTINAVAPTAPGPRPATSAT